ncbi:hypothetical protein BT96DRAFT_824008, partial [Gymnopus androsaceus JB14]
VVVRKKEVVNIFRRSSDVIVACENCLVGPGKGREHSKCSACGITRYCRTHWPKHKIGCQETVKMRATQKVREAQCLAQGKVFYDPMTLRFWFKKNYNVCEYAAWHALEIYKGPDKSYFSTYLVVISLTQDPDAPNDVSKVDGHSIAKLAMELEAEEKVAGTT